jgi:hypothetical protein
MRSYIDLFESILREFDLVPGGTNRPPVAQDEGGGGRREQQGEYWIKGSKLVPLPPDNYGHKDWCTSVYFTPEAFGLSREQLMEIIEDGYPYLADILKRGGGPQFSGARTFGESILLDRGWGYIEYDLPSRIMIRASQANVRQVVNDVADRLPLLQVETIVLYTVDTSDPITLGSQRVSAREFHKEDFGYGGAFSSLLAVAGGDPGQHISWIYTKTDNPHRDIVPKQGLVRHGNWVGRDQYYVKYVPERIGRNLRDKANWVRFPSTFLKGCESAPSTGELIAYSAKPFSIPASALQRWNGQRWVGGE